MPVTPNPSVRSTPTVACMLLATVLPCATAGAAPLAAPADVGGRVIAIGDDRLLSDSAFDALPADAAALALNCAEFLGGDPRKRSASILVYSTNDGLIGSALAATMQAAGYAWTVDASAPLTPSLLAEYDAVYLAGVHGSGETNAAVLAQYVIDGGSVLICSGTGAFGSDAGVEAAAWNPFLEQFGLLFVGANFPIPDPVTVALLKSENPVAAGVESIHWEFGQAVFEAKATIPLTDSILGDFTEWGLFPSGVIGSSRTACAGPCPADLDGDGVVDGADLGAFLGSWGGTGPMGDLDCDEVVDGIDLGLMLGAWGPC